MKAKKIYIVKFMSTGESDSPCSKYSKIYNKFAIIDTGGNIDEIIEGLRLQEQEAFQQVNKCKVTTKVVAKEVITINQILVSKNDNH